MFNDLGARNSADASGNATGAETSGNPAGNVSASGVGGATLYPSPSSMRDELFQDLASSCITMLRVFSLAVELRPCATRKDSRERFEREQQQTIQAMEDRELYQQFLVFKEAMKADPNERIERRSRPEGRDRSRSCRR